MKLFGRTTSFNVQKVLWLLEELSVNYEHVELGGRFGGLDDKDFIKLNPMKKVPVLIDGNKSVWESHTILRYLATCYGNENWYPACPYERSLSERWLDWSQTVFQPAFMGTFWGYYRKPENKRDMEAVNRDLDTCINCLQVIEEQLKQSEYLAGKNISLADIVVGAVIYRLVSQGLSLELPDLVNRWYDKLSKRPGYIKWVMSDFTELKAREDF
ncbi:glutathione S-transferase [Pseudoalteromonas sp. MSK9-3]|uniref:glutathione S-transferase family protein n=1 Tax=Pseudoalteromonas sp. MSK9-3 TaxID=1897633 RepID=UPI000E6D0E93|nr:glutathione S-transferase family protein [Pseudoalteromonas sp. MSK9-3]RJE70987.1 glutathione S-transferase [Pseudoalteromonas sp. MSK9-3]